MLDLQYDELITFGTIDVGGKATINFSYKFETSSSNNSTITVEQHPEIINTLNPFTIQKKNQTDGQTNLIVIYKPTVPSQIYCNYYLIKHLENTVVLCVKGRSSDLSIRASVKRLNFHRFKSSNKCKAVFELKNLSNINIQYQFDIDNKQNIFHVEPTIGEILTNKHVYIHVVFKTEKSGIFFMELACLIHFHAPIMIDLYGVNAVKIQDSVSFLNKLKRFYVPLKWDNGFERYMCEYFGEIDSKLVSIMLQYSGGCNDVQLTNATNKCAKIKWDTENEHVFRMGPIQKCLKPNERGLFEVQQNDVIADRLYGSIIYGRAFLYQQFELEELFEGDPFGVPVSLTLRLLGNTFSATGNIWFPQITLESTNILLPICSPNQSSVYNTFVLRKCGHLPVAFKFIPPQQTNELISFSNRMFNVKPMQGLITGPFQIVVVEFKRAQHANSYSEKWSIQLNQTNENVLDICFHALVQIPALAVGDIVFGNVFPGCQQLLQVAITNRTQLAIRYKFHANKWIQVESSSGDLDCYETSGVELIYTAVACNVPEKFHLCYQLSVLQDANKLQLGQSYEYSAPVYAKCSYSQLCAIPNYYNFGEIQCCQRYECTFTLFNFGECEMNFLIRYQEAHDGFVVKFEEEEEDPVRIEPEMGTLGAHQNTNITVTLRTVLRSDRILCIWYHVRKAADTMEIVEQISETFKTKGFLLRIDYFSFYPTLKVVDIGKNVTGPLFGKFKLWELFNIDQLNKILSNICANEMKQLEIRVPDAELNVSTIMKLISLTVKNISAIDTECRLERVKVCDCQPTEITTNISKRSYSYETACLHRKLVNAQISDSLVRAGSTQFLSVHISYLVEDRQHVRYMLHLCNNRTVQMDFVFIGLRPGTLSTYASGFHLQFYNVYLAEQQPELQMFWFYNNTREGAHYRLDVKRLQQYNELYGREILACVNPEGWVQPKSMHMMMFKFNPIHLQRITIALPFKFGSRGTGEMLTISGQGVMFYQQPIDKITGTGPNNNYYHPYVFVQISTEHVIIRAIPTHSSTVRFVTLRNITDRCIAFWFDTYLQEHVLKITLSPSHGTLRPHESVLLLMHIYTYSNACALRVVCSCYLLDQTALREHILSNSEYHRKGLAVTQQFDISDKKITYPKLDVVVREKPRVFHRPITVSCYVVGIADTDLKMSIRQQLKQHPPPLYHDRQSATLCSCYRHHCLLNLNDQHFNIVRIVLECLLKDVLYSKKFKYYINGMTSNHRCYYYLQNQNYSTKAENNTIPDTTLSNVLHYLLEDCLMQYYQLGAHPKEEEEEEEEKKKFHNNNNDVDVGIVRMGARELHSEKFSFLIDTLM